MNLAIHHTRSSHESDEAKKIKSMIANMNKYMQKKVDEEFGVRFDSKNVDILHSSRALDPANEEYLNYTSLEYLLNYFDFMNINRSLLKIEFR